MSLDRYRRPRMVVLNPRCTAYEAARAMVDNHIGAVLVGEDQHVTGILTDRDLALEIVAADLDPRGTYVRSIMSDEVACCDVNASVADVVQNMREHACRRVPLTENDRPVGIVTLDDLLINGDIDQATARAIVLSQLEIEARFKAEGVPFPTEPARREFFDGRVRARLRRKARAEHTYHRLLRAVERHTGLDSRNRAERALAVVLAGICRRLTPQEARHFIAQLPSMLHAELDAQMTGPDKSVTTESIERQLKLELGLAPDAAADVLYSVCEAVADSVSEGEIEAVRDQLPSAMNELFPTPLRKSA